ncbi:MAG: hypothetical protein ACPHF4_04050, partial [Rubripirellula sp.]
GSGLPVIYESSRISSRLLLRDLGLDASFIDDACTNQEEDYSDYETNTPCGPREVVRSP